MQTFWGNPFFLANTANIFTLLMFVPQCHYWCRGPVPCPQALLPTGAPCTPDPALTPQPALGRGLGPSPWLPVQPPPIHPGQELGKGRCTRFSPWALYGLLDDFLEPANAVWSIMPRKAYPSACAFPNHWYSSDKKIRVGNGGLTGLDSSIYIYIFLHFLCCIIHIYANGLFSVIAFIASFLWFHKAARCACIFHMHMEISSCILLAQTSSAVFNVKAHPQLQKPRRDISKSISAQHTRFHISEGHGNVQLHSCSSSLQNQFWQWGQETGLSYKYLAHTGLRLLHFLNSIHIL